jgi:mono/diheme cytochrome c family protein
MGICRPANRGSCVAGVRPGWALALVLAWWWAFQLAAQTVAEPTTVSFNHQIRPLLSDRCFSCHGPDERARKGKLRLDTSEDGLAPRGARGDRWILVPGDPERSELYLRIASEDEMDLMPPAESNLKLDEEERALIRRWIEQGAEYQPHWAFIPVAEVEVPLPAESSESANPIDAFVQARLEREGMGLAPRATRETLIRRLRFDLTGLPPSLEEIDALVADDAPDAYERLVDRLLAEPAYGERRANEWLDLARYADTYGYQSDVEVDLSPWRDWVIRAFNDNLAYDQFVTWQLAGDLLPSPARDQLLATAFNRLHRQTNEGGSIEEEFRTEYAADRVQTAGTAFLGLTMECARCHDHKFDPISQKDFFRMFAFFNNIDESGLYSHFTRATPTPTMLLYPDGVEAGHRALKDQIADVEAKRVQSAEAARKRFEDWRNATEILVVQPEPVSAFDFEWIEGDKTMDRLDTNRVATLVDEPLPTGGKSGQAIQFNGDNLAVLKGVGDFNRTSAFSFRLWVRPAEVLERGVIFHRSRAWADSGSRGYELVLEEMRPAFGLIHFWPGNAIRVKALEPLPVGAWSQLTITYDGSSRADGIRLYRDGQPMALETVRDHLFKDIVHRKEWGDSDVGNIELTLAGRFRDSGFKGGAIDEFQVFDWCLTPLEARGEWPVLSGLTDNEALFVHYLERIDPEYRTLTEELARLRASENAMVNDIPEMMVMREMTERRPTFLLKRGAYDAPGEAVEPGVPSSIMPFAEELPRNRLGLARWITDPRNPLTARVAVNRIWRSCFGRGLVATAEDFGSQSQLPTHPELLDWLAREFVESGWDVKAMFRQIVLSATYRQSSDADPRLLAEDPENRLLARGPKHRLEAEQIRDNALAISGLLVSQVGGPSVRPYQPAGLWEESGTGKTYVQDQGEKLYRRSLYTFWRRTAPPPSMLIFDAVSREVCTAKRESTSTPLQALVLLNDPQFVEAARVLAQRLWKVAPDDAGLRVEMAFRLATGRLPEPRERAILEQAYDEQLALFGENPEEALEYLETGEGPVLEDVPVDELAATAVLASTLMNLDEFIMKP